VENSKRTVVSSLRRETSSDLPLLQSIHEVKRFKEKLESIIDRFGEVSGSHNRVMNVFMKKYAGKLKGEFETLSSLLKETKSLTSEFEEENSVIVKSIDLLNILSQKITSIKANEDKIGNTCREIETLKYELDELKNQLSSLENSTQFKEFHRNLEQIDAIEKEKQEFHRNITDLYSHVSRAFTKYSYGMTKDTLGRLRVLTEEPWKIFDDAEASSYTSLLVEIQKAVKSGKIKLKDSERTIHYMEIILKSLPEHKHKIKSINVILNALHENKNGLVVNKSKELKDDIRNCSNRLGDLEQSLDQLKKQLTENNSECEGLVMKIEDCILQITGKRYSLTT
jgi:chromosome segregation ATPase